MCHDAVIQINGYRDTITLDEIPLSSYDVILGEPWMRTKNCIIHWRQQRISISHDDGTINLYVDRSADHHSLPHTTDTTEIMGGKASARGLQSTDELYVIGSTNHPKPNHRHYFQRHHHQNGSTNSMGCI
jgi:hypothetical protein